VSETVTPQGLPESIFVLFQMTFAVITPALIVGAFPERVSFPFLILFTAGWLLLVYCPVAHWVWGQGWLAAEGTLDFAGGIVVHTTAGVSALVATVLIGARRGFPHTLSPPHSPGMTMAGGGMLWVGWFGFNGGSALAANGAAAMAILVTHVAAAAGSLAWMTLEWVRFRKPSVLGIATGMVAGLGTITPASGYVGPAGALVIGLVAGVVCFLATQTLKRKLRVDDSLDVFPVHGVGGFTGLLLTAVFSAPAVGGLGLPTGVTVAKQLGVQLLGAAATAVWCGLATFVLLKVVNAVVPLRVSREQENEGLDLVLHEERGYSL
jgi:Amt family ammonium transporter